MHDEEFQVRRQGLDQEWLTSMEQEGMTLEDAVLVRTVRTRKVLLYRCEGMALEPGHKVVVETERGTTEGVVMEAPARRWVQVKTVRRVVRPIDRPPEGWQAQRYQEREKQARSACIELLTRLKLDMKLVDVELVWWENRTVFYFVAEGRVDFRDMVKELSRNLRCRIEMRQVGPRDETKMLRGYGRCGREHCCSNYLSEFHSVRTKMAKEQGIVVNQDKITGHCRKLLCCLAYERDTYAALREEMLPVGSRVETPDGKGKIVELHVIRGGIKVLLDDGGGFREFPKDKVRLLDSDGMPVGPMPGAVDGSEDGALGDLEDDGNQPREIVVVEDGDAGCGEPGSRPAAAGGPEGDRGGDRGRPRDRGEQRHGERRDGRPGDRGEPGRDGRSDVGGAGRPEVGGGERRSPALGELLNRLKGDGGSGQAPSSGDLGSEVEIEGALLDSPVDGSDHGQPPEGGEGPGVGQERTGRRRRRRRRGGGSGGNREVGHEAGGGTGDGGGGDGGGGDGGGGD